MCPCDEREERAAIIEYDAGIERSQAERQARLQTCVGCDKAGKIDLLNIWSVKNGKSDL